MGLAERRAIKDFQDNKFPELKKTIDKSAGFAIDVDVQWDTLAVDDQSALYAECFPKVYFSPVIDALKSICADKMGKDALKSSLKKIVICNVKGNYYGDTAVSFQSGVLQIDHQPITNVDDVQDRTKAIITILEKSI